MAVELATGFVNIVPSARGFSRKLGSEINGPLSRAGSDAGRDASRGFASTLTAGIARSAGGIARVATKALAATAIVGGGVAAVFGKQAIDAASDLNETVSKTNVVLGDAADEVIKWSLTTSKSLGQSQQAALDAASQFGVFGKSAGLQGPELAKFSVGLTELASDMASFSNTSPEEAALALGAALRGEQEPIRRYGVLLDDATLRNEALKLGLIKTTKDALTPQQKVLAAQSQIFKQTADAQGDFARTSDGLANRQRIVAAQFENVKAKIGSALLPVAQKFFGFIADTGLPSFERLGESAVRVVGPAFEQLGGTVAELFGIFAKGDFTGVGPFEEDSPIIAAAFRLREAFINIGGAVSGVGATVGRFVTTKLVPLATSIVTQIIPVLVRLGQQASRVFVKVIAPVLGDIADLLRTRIVPAVRIVAEVFSKFFGVIADNAGPAQLFAKITLGLLVARFAALKIQTKVEELSKFVKAVRAGETPTLKLLKTIGTFSKQAATTALNVTRATAAFVAQKAAMVASAVASKVLAVAQLALNVVMSANPVVLLVAAIAALAVGIFLAYQKFKPFRDIVDAVGRALAAAAGFIVGAAMTAFNWIKDHWPLILTILTGPIGLAVAFIIKNWNKILGFAKTIFGAIATTIGFYINTIRTIITTVWNVLKTATTVAWNLIKAAVLTPFNLIKTTIETVVGGLKTVWDRFWNGLPKVVEGAVRIVKGAINGILGAIQAVYDGFKTLWNAIQIDIPKIDPPGPGPTFGGFTLGLPDLPDLNIPRLAKGAVVSEETLAIIGEVPNQREIVAPEALLRSIVRDELAEGRDRKVADQIVFNHIKDPNDAVQQLTWAQRTGGR